MRALIATPGARRRSRSLLRALGVAAIAAAAFLGGYGLAGGDRDADSTEFHDMRVLPPESLRALVDGGDPAVAGLARGLATPREAYRFVRDEIAFDPSRPAGYPAETLRDRAASCLGKAALLASLYRALGFPDEEVRVVTGQVHYGGQVVEHAWVEVELEGRCLQQDATPLLGSFAFDQFPGTDYTLAHVRRELFCFNDEGFAVVSQRNRFRGEETPVFAGP